MTAGGTEATCLPATDHVDSVLALDLWTGHVKLGRPGDALVGND